MVLYQCALCNFETKIITHFNRHKNTKKHIRNMEQEKIKNGKNAPLDKNILFPPKNEGEVKSSLNLPPQFPSISLNFPQFSKKNDSEIFQCEFCSKKFSRKDNLNRHRAKTCKEKNAKEANLLKKIDELENQLNVKQEQIDSDKEHFKGILEEKDKCINILKDQYNNISSSHFQIIQNNIITMSPIKFLNTFCSNNPTLEQVANFIRTSEYSITDLTTLNQGIELKNKTVIGNEIDTIIKQKNRELIKNFDITNGTCDNVLFINDGSGRKFITKSDPGWNYCQNDDTLDEITSALIDQAVKSNSGLNLLPKKEREGINKIVKVNNDYSKQKETLTSKILEDEMCKYTIQDEEENAISSNTIITVE
jgi:hypothetical protein